MVTKMNHNYKIYFNGLHKLKMDQEVNKCKDMQDHQRDRIITSTCPNNNFNLKYHQDKKVSGQKARVLQNSHHRCINNSYLIRIVKLNQRKLCLMLVRRLQFKLVSHLCMVEVIKTKISKCIIYKTLYPLFKWTRTW